MAAPRKPEPEAFEVMVENLPLNDDGWKALEQRVQARQPGLRATFVSGFDRYGRPAARPGPRKGLRVTVTAVSRAAALDETRRRLESAMKGWKDLRFYDPASALGSARFSVLPRPKAATPPAGGGSPARSAGSG